MKRKLQTLLKERILILDGAMGTMIQEYKLSEEDYRSSKFADSEKLQKGNNDLLSLTQPQIIEEIHRGYLEAGADIICTNTFNAQSVSMLDYGMESYVKEINIESARIAKELTDEFTKKNPNKPRFVAGAIGPTNRTASMSPKVEDPMYRAVNFDDLVLAYSEQIEGLMEGGVDIILIETIFDTLNAKAALFAADKVFEKEGNKLPIMLSVTLSDKGGRTLSGQTIGAFLASVQHSNCISIGLNCSFGADEMAPFLKELSRLTSSYVSVYPNAGLPNQLGEYDETPEKMASQIKKFVNDGLVNIIGGCCGTTPAHIALYTDLIEDIKPREIPEKREFMQLSGLELFELNPNINFVNIGERCNVAGSRRFLRLINEEKYEEALSIAQKQVENGAQILDINMDDGLLDASVEMTRFLNLLASDPDISRVPVMVDSSKWDVLEAGLKCTQGKSVVNSISLKEGEEEFLSHARIIRKYGAAAIIMAFDEKGQADTFLRRIEICERAYNLLVADGFNPHDIIFDPNILAIATGMAEHKPYAKDFLNTITWIKENLPHAKISGGLSNLSFSFRGNNYLREAMHSVFLYHAIKRGMDMAIVNPSQSVLYDDIPEKLRKLIEDLIFNRRAEAEEELIEYAEGLRYENQQTVEVKEEEWRKYSLEERLQHSLIKGVNDYLEEDLEEALQKYPKAVNIIDEPLMDAMNKVGELFGSGKMFLPQVVKTARTMKQAVAILQPTLEKENEASSAQKAGKLLLATVKGDVHDIGKNIASIILSCNNYEVVDLGVMVPSEEIIRMIREEKPDIVGLSGLITPSLEEMTVVANEMQKAGIDIPLLISGATTSNLHTALKIEPQYKNGAVVYVKDASQAPSTVSKLMNPKTKVEFENEMKLKYEELRIRNSENKKELVPYTYALENPMQVSWDNYKVEKPNIVGRKVLPNISVDEIIPFINWKFFFPAWNLSSRYAMNPTHRESDKEKIEEAKKLWDDAKSLLKELKDSEIPFIKAVFGIYDAHSENESMVINNIQIPVLRQEQKNKDDVYRSLMDYIAKDKGEDYLAPFTVSAGNGLEPLFDKYEKEGDEYKSLLLKSLLDRVAEATTEWLHWKIRTEYWGFAKDENLSPQEMFGLRYQGIRPAVGYPSLPDQSVNFLLNEDLLNSSEIGVKLTENGVMIPTASVSGIIFAHPDAKYFSVGKIADEQVKAYSKNRGLSVKLMNKFLAANI